jgi:hypothetical protein
MFKNLLIYLLMLFVTYTINGPVTIEWDDQANPPSTSFKVLFIREGTGEEFLFTTTTSSITARPPKSGKYEVRVYAERAGMESDPCSSLDATCAKLTDGTNGDWKVYWKPAGPGGPMVIY